MMAVRLSQKISWNIGQRFLLMLLFSFFFFFSISFSLFHTFSSCSSFLSLFLLISSFFPIPHLSLLRPIPLAILSSFYFYSFLYSFLLRFQLLTHALSCFFSCSSSYSNSFSHSLPPSSTYTHSFLLPLPPRFRCRRHHHWRRRHRRWQRNKLRNFDFLFTQEIFGWLSHGIQLHFTARFNLFATRRRAAPAGPKNRICRSQVGDEFN